MQRIADYLIDCLAQDYPAKLEVTVTHTGEFKVTLKDCRDDFMLANNANQWLTATGSTVPQALANLEHKLP